MRLDAVLDVIEHAYAAVLEPARWTEALTGYAKLVDARAAGLRVETFGVGVEQEWVGLERAFDRAYVEHYWTTDPWAAHALDGAVGVAAHGDAIVARRIVESSAYHNELARPYGFDDLAGVVLERSDSRLVTMAAMRCLGDPRFTDEHDRTSCLVAPHFRRAIHLQAHLGAGEAPRPSATVASLLETRYHLTPAEIRVAVRVAQGLSPKEVAQALGSSWNTVRAHLRKIFAKTETSSQSALARLVTLLETTHQARQALRR